MQLDTDSLINRIIGDLKKVNRDLTGKDKSAVVWTMNVKRQLYLLGRELEYLTSASGTHARRHRDGPRLIEGGGADFGAWLYDVCWLDYERKAGELKYLKSLRLVAECEWGNQGDVEDDFEKLLAARANLRVMVFEAEDPEGLEKIVTRLEYLERQFEMRQPQDRYLLVGRDMRSGTVYAYQLPRR